MSPDIERLIKLQHIDSRIAEARSAIAAHPQRLADLEARLASSRQALDAAKARLSANQDERRIFEKDVATYQGRLSKFRDQQSAVKTNREYQALGHEIETAQHDLSAAEEKVIERMVAADDVGADLKAAESAFSTEQATLAAEKATLGEDLAGYEADLKRALESRTAIVAELDPRFLALFEQVARARKGIATSAATRDGLCSVCHVRLRPQVFQLVRTNDGIIQCDSCQRILYYVPPPPPIEQAIVRN